MPALTRRSVISALGSIAAGAAAAAVGAVVTPRSQIASPPLGSDRFAVMAISRAEWGADESLRFGEDGAERFPVESFPVQSVVVHHSAIPVSKDPAAGLRAIYFDHAVNQGLGDVGYHVLIDPGGRIYEGRWSGENGFTLLSPGQKAGGKPMLSSGAHVGGFNAGNVGVCLMGEFTSTMPSQAAIDSLVSVLAALASVCDLDPLGRTNYVNPISGDKRMVDTISGHRDWLATGCPGDQFYLSMPSIRSGVSKLLSARPL